MVFKNIAKVIFNKGLRHRKETSTCLLCSCFVFLFNACLLAITSYNGRNILSVNKSSSDQEQFHCITSRNTTTTKCKPICKKGTFGLYGMATCQPWLTCNETGQIAIKKLYTPEGYVKWIYHGIWNGHDVIVKQYRERNQTQGRYEYINGIRLLKEFGSNQNVLQFIGDCGDMHVTEIHPVMAAVTHKQFKEYPQYDNIKTRFQLCINYLEILSELHSGRDGKIYVMCDCNSLIKLLSQYLLTEDFRLVLSDVDSLEEIVIQNGKKIPIKCVGWGQISGEFAAPEQRWHLKEEYNASKMNTYDEKIDIWKVPEMCNYFLGDSLEAEVVKTELSVIHVKCKSVTPSQRPAAKEILHFYKQILSSHWIFKNVQSSNLL